MTYVGRSFIPSFYRYTSMQFASCMPISFILDHFSAFLQWWWTRTYIYLLVYRYLVIPTYEENWTVYFSKNQFASGVWCYKGTDIACMFGLRSGLQTHNPDWIKRVDFQVFPIDYFLSLSTFRAYKYFLQSCSFGWKLFFNPSHTFSYRGTEKLREVPNLA